MQDFASGVVHRLIVWTGQKAFDFKTLNTKKKKLTSVLSVPTEYLDIKSLFSENPKETA